MRDCGYCCVSSVGGCGWGLKTSAVTKAVAFKALHANHFLMTPWPAAGQPIFRLERARVTRT